MSLAYNMRVACSGFCNFQHIRWHVFILEALGTWRSLTILDLSSYQFVGDIPMSLGHLTNLTLLDFPSNNLSSHASTLSKLWGCPQLETLRLGSNSLVEKLGLDFRKMSSLKYFFASSNNITRTTTSILKHLQFQPRTYGHQLESTQMVFIPSQYVGHF